MPTEKSLFSSSKDKLVARVMPGTCRQMEEEGADRQVLIPFIPRMGGRHQGKELRLTGRQQEEGPRL